MNELIAIIDDEPDIVELVSIHLEKSNFRIKKFYNSKSFLKESSQEIPDLLLLDLMLPDADGLELCKEFRKDKKFDSMAIIMLTAKSEEIDKILGLELGADDYVTKPFSPKELIARIKAVLRRKCNGKKIEEEKISTSKFIKVDNLIQIDIEKHEVKIDGKIVDLTATEFKLLRIFCENRNIVFSRNKLLDLLWGSEKNVIDRTIDVHIKHLRNKIKKAGKLIKNIRGVGYKLTN